VIPRGNDIFAPIYREQAPFRLAMILRAAYGGGIITSQVVINIAASIVLFGLSWILLERFNTYDQVPGRESKLKGRLRAALPTILRTRRRARRAPSGNPGWAIVWKDFWLFGGGLKWWMLRVVGYITMGFLFSLDGWGSLEKRIGVGLILSSFWAGIAEIVFHAGHLFQREVKEQTWDSLRMLPVSTGLLCRRKIVGALWALVPTFVALGLGILLEGGLFREIEREFDRNPGFAFCMTVYCMATPILAVYITCYFGLRINPWLGTVVAAGTFGFICFTPFMCCFGLMRMDGPDSAPAVLFLAATLNLAIAMGFHMPIWSTLNGETNG
ncbi:MAG TPA: hypothetical protein VM452_20050, partial [Caulifigura sp.]|nr:hypothetical protein [Caulifigura sp.]